VEKPERARGHALLRDQRVRFVAIGAMNTLIDFALLNLLSVLGLSPLVANIISTGLTMAISFVLNRRYTFASSSQHYVRDVVLFIVFTLLGLWVLQNLIIAGLLAHLPSDWPVWLRLNGAKVLATGASMVWNYLSYKYIVFR
jgi:putative flippase GtrA